MASSQRPGARRKGLVQSPRTVIVMPAHNEEKDVVQTLDLIKRTGLRERYGIEVMVVDDYSTDRTREAVRAWRKRNSWVSLVSRRAREPGQERGKGQAVFLGLSEALGRSPTAILLFDADMRQVPRRGLEQLIVKTMQANRKGQVRMAIAPQWQGDPRYEGPYLYNSGVRGLSAKAVQKLLRSPRRKIGHGYGLEMFMNFELGGLKHNMGRAPEIWVQPPRAHKMFMGRPPGRPGFGAKHIREPERAEEQMIAALKAAAKRERLQRRQRQRRRPPFRPR